jgi:hypothetical protein
MIELATKTITADRRIGSQRDMTVTMVRGPHGVGESGQCRDPELKSQILYSSGKMQRVRSSWTAPFVDAMSGFGSKVRV